MSAFDADRLSGAFLRIIKALLPRLIYFGTYEYRVLDATPGPPTMIDCVAVDPDVATILPANLNQLTLWPGPSGAVAVPAPGTTVRIAFANMDPSKPMVVGLDPATPPLIVQMYAATTIQLGDVLGTPLAKTVPVAAYAAALVAAGSTPPVTLPELATWAAAVTAASTALGTAMTTPAGTTVKTLAT